MLVTTLSGQRLLDEQLFLPDPPMPDDGVFDSPKYRRDLARWQEHAEDRLWDLEEDVENKPRIMSEERKAVGVAEQAAAVA
jgi:hypothetical protein